MSDEQVLVDPTNRVVCVFDQRAQAEAARAELLKLELTEKEIRVLQGEETAEKVDTSPKWFADTDEEIARYKRELKAGGTVLSVPIADRETREKVHDVLKRHDARLITHFGEWVTEMLK